MDMFAICLLYVKCLCVLSCYLSPAIEIWIILTGCSSTRDKHIYIDKEKQSSNNLIMFLLFHVLLISEVARYRP